MAAVEAETFLNGKPFEAVTEFEWLAFNKSLQDRAAEGHPNRMGQGTRYTRLVYLKALLKDRLEIESLPKRIGDALYMEQPEDPECGQFIANEWVFRFLRTLKRGGRRARAGFAPTSSSWFRRSSGSSGIPGAASGRF